MLEKSIVDLAMSLIEKESISPNDAGCQDILIHRLQQLGFTIEEMNFADTRNFWARRGQAAPLFVFAGHTDVVPAGPSDKWHTPPFSPQIIGGYLYGRGAADMKSSLACMLIAVEQFLAAHPNHQGSIGFLITSDEEGDFINGTPKVIEKLMQRNEYIDMCIVGEPSSTEKLGDVIKNGRRGTLTGKLTIHGKQGHVAYPHLADNALHQALPAMTALSQIIWDEGNTFFPPTSLQIANMHAGTGATNIIPGQCHIQFNFRFNDSVTAEQLKYRVHDLLDQYPFTYHLDWFHNGDPFLTKPGRLVAATQEAVEHITQAPTTLQTSGGTSDGRFIAKMGTEVIELGPVNATIHQINECVRVADLPLLTAMYQRTLQNLLTKQATEQSLQPDAS